MDSIKSKVLAVISDTFDVPVSEISPSDTADDIDGWDSLSHVTLMLSLSREFGIHIVPAETETISSIQGLIFIIEKKLNSK